LLIFIRHASGETGSREQGSDIITRIDPDGWF